MRATSKKGKRITRMKISNFYSTNQQIYFSYNATVSAEVEDSMQDVLCLQEPNTQ